MVGTGMNDSGDAIMWTRSNPPTRTGIIIIDIQLEVTFEQPLSCGPAGLGADSD